jgi:hypothetical protein
MLACSGLGFEVLPDLQAQRNKKLRRKKDKRNWSKSFRQGGPHRLGGLYAENQSSLSAFFLKDMVNISLLDGSQISVPVSQSEEVENIA